MHDLIQDIRFAARQLRRAPGFTLAAVLTLALGIGANGTMFSLANGFLWQPLPVAHPEQLVNVLEHNPVSGAWGDLSYADYRDVRAATEVFADVIAYYPIPLALSDGGRNERLYGEIVSANYFAMLGVPAAAGRVFGAADTAAVATPVAVISHDFWRRRFAADPAVVGRTVKLNGRAFTIIGVAPATFHSVFYVGFRPALWVPANQYAAVVPSGRLDTRDGSQFRMMARLAPGVSLERAQSVITNLMTRLAETWPATHRGREAMVLRHQDARPEPGLAGAFTVAARLFLIAVGLVLLIACANVANLLLARANGRRKEIAIRLAMGASRGRLIRQLLAESLLLAAMGALAGAGLAAWASGGVAAMLRLPTDIPFVFDFAINGRALAYIAAVAVVAGVVFGLVPALQAARPELVGALKNETVTGRGVRRSRLRSALVVGQVAVSCVLLIVAVLAVRTLVNLRDLGTGFDARHGLLVGVAPELQGLDRARSETFYREVARRVAELPGVEAVSAAQYVPLDFASNGGRIFVDGHEVAAGETGVETAGWSQVLPGFFDALGVRLADGRDFTARDDSAAPPVAVVNATLAHRYWPDGRAIGRQLRLDRADAPLVTVVGVAPDMVYSNPNEPPRPYVYLPITQRFSGEATLLVRGTGDPLRLAPAVTGVIAALEPDLPVDVRSYSSLVTGRALLMPRFAASLAGAFGALALLLAVIGLYGVVAYTAGQRVREIGIRIALGADRGAVLGLIVGGGLRQALVGVGIGVTLALGATRLMRGLLYGVGALDPLTFALVPLALVGIAMVASFIPARRATRVDPMVALRSE